MEPSYPNIDELMEFLKSVQLPTSTDIAVPHEPAPDWRKDVTTFEEHLDHNYGPVGTERRDEYERGLKDFMENLPLPETEQ